MSLCRITQNRVVRCFIHFFLWTDFNGLHRHDCVYKLWKLELGISIATVLLNTDCSRMITWIISFQFPISKNSHNSQPGSEFLDSMPSFAYVCDISLVKLVVVTTTLM